VRVVLKLIRSFYSTRTWQSTIISTRLGTSTVLRELYRGSVGMKSDETINFEIGHAVASGKI
jgi:hypothetical protein